MWNLNTEKDGKRIFSNEITGGKCSQTRVYTDKEGNSWWNFDDMVSIPYTRQFAAQRITSLYSLGLSKDDLTGHISGLKAILKSEDKEKYEKAFALVLDFENKATTATDAVKQMSSLVCVYFTMNSEDIDSFENSLQLKKMSLMQNDPAMHAFFLNRQTDNTEAYIRLYGLLSQTASQLLTES